LQRPVTQLSVIVAPIPHRSPVGSDEHAVGIPSRRKATTSSATYTGSFLSSRLPSPS
jgi:hypothetical protein